MRNLLPNVDTLGKKLDGKLDELMCVAEAATLLTANMAARQNTQGSG